MDDKSFACLKELIIEAYTLYKQMEQARSFEILRKSKLVELSPLINLNDNKHLLQEIIKLRNQHRFDAPSKFKSLIEVLACYAEVLAKIIFPEYALILLESKEFFTPETRDLPTQDYIAKFNAFKSRTKSYIDNIIIDQTNFRIENEKQIKYLQDEIIKLNLDREHSKKSIKLLDSQNASFKKSLETKEIILREKSHIETKLQTQIQSLNIKVNDDNKLIQKLQTNLNQDHKKIQDLQNQLDQVTKSATETHKKLSEAQKILLLFNEDNKELSKKYNDQLNKIIQLNNKLTNIQSYYLLNPKHDISISEHDIEDLINYIIADMTLEARYNAALNVLTIDNNTTNAALLEKEKNEIVYFYSQFSSIYREILFEATSKSYPIDEKEYKTNLKELSKNSHALADKAITKIMDYNNIRMFRFSVSQIQITDKSQVESSQAIEFNNTINTRKKIIAEFYEEILKRIENIEKNKLFPLATRTKHFAHRNYNLLFKNALTTQDKLLSYISSQRNTPSKAATSQDKSSPSLLSNT